MFSFFLFIDIVHNITSNSRDNILFFLFCFEKQIKSFIFFYFFF